MSRPRQPAKERFAKMYAIADSGCWEWLGHIGNNGYGYFRVDPTKNNTGSHRASWVIHNGDIPEGMCVLHKCDNKVCVNPDHLYIGDHKQNAKDAMERGGYKYGKDWFAVGRKFKVGECHHNSKLTENQVILIRQSGKTGKELSDIFGVSTNTISRVRNNKIWRHIHVAT